MKTLKLNAIILASLAVIIAAILLVYHITHKTVVTKPTIIHVMLAQPSWKNLPDIVTATATLNPINQATISSKVSGYITHINFKEGDTVKTGTLLIQLDNSKQKNALAAAKIDAKQGELQYRQANTIYSKRLSSFDTYFSAKVTRAKDEAALRTAETNLKEQAISAPFSGTIGAKNVSVGDYVSPGSPLLTLTDTKHLLVEYALPLTYLDSIKLNQAVTITSPMLGNKQFIGKVTFIAPTIDTSTQTIAVHAEVDNSQDQLKPGLSVSIKQAVGAQQRALVVPSDSVFASAKGYYVYGVKQQKAVKIPVSVGRKFVNSVEILSGLSPTQAFVVSGQTLLQPGNLVNVAKKQIT